MTGTRPPHEDPELLARALARGPECPPLERLAELVHGQVDAAERAALEAHAASCPACAAELELARAFDPAATDAAEAADIDRVAAALDGRGGSARVLAFPGRRERRTRSAASPAWTRWAAAALVLLGIGFAFQATRQALPPEVLGPIDGDVVRGSELEPIAPIGEVAVVPAELAFGTVAGAARYRVELLDVAGKSLWSADVAAPPAPLDEPARALLRSRASYGWRAVALAADGAELARTVVVEFSLP
jgi:anti-sigma factor RsiW